MAGAHVQSRSIQGNSVTSVSLAFLADVTAGSLILVAGSNWGRTFSAGSCTDSRGQTYAMDVSGTTDSPDLRIGCWSHPNAAAGPTTITLGATGTVDDITIAIHEYSGMVTSAALDVGTTASGSGATHSSGATAATSQADALVFGFGTHDVGGSPVGTAGATFTQRTLETSTANMPLLTEDKFVSSVGPQTATISWGNGPYLTGVAVYKVAATATSEQIAGESEGASEDVGTIRVRVRISGVSEGGSADVITDTTLNVLGSAVSTGSSLDTGQVTTRIRIAGVSHGESADAITDTILNVVGTAMSPGSSQDTGAITARVRIAGVSLGSSLDTAGVDASRASLAGVSDGASADAGSITVRVRLAGTSTGGSSDHAFVGDVQLAELAGVSTGSSVDAANVTVRVRISGLSEGGSLDRVSATDPVAPVVQITRPLYFVREVEMSLLFTRSITRALKF